MRLKEDTSSYRASGVMVRDARHVHNGPEAPRGARSKKDRKRWCGGHVGREHKPECIVKRQWNDRVRWYVLACTTCGKELAHHFPFIDSGEKPAWVM
jgi:hypothetical protein